jgi:adenylate cyclase
MMRFRLGVNLGDVTEQEGALYGDGVNIAARLQSLAQSGGICVSGTVYDQVEGKVPGAFTFAGEQSVKNIVKPVRVYHAQLDFAKEKQVPAPRSRAKRAAMVIGLVLLAGAVVAAWVAMTRSPPAPDQPPHAVALTLPDQPSIAVLPFTNLSGKPEDDWFTDGMTETLITDLSRLNNLFIIARNSTFTYKGKPVDVRRVGQELGVRYVLEGSVQRTGERLRVNAQLVEASTGRHLWAERYDRKPADLFAIQDDLTQQIVTALDVTLLEGEQARTWRGATRNAQAYDLFLRGRVPFYRFTREDMARAQALFQQSLDLDPDFTMGMLYLGWTHFNQANAGWSRDPKESYEKAQALGRRAADIDPSLGDAYKLLSGVLLVLDKHSEAVAAAEKALALSPSQADILAWSGFVLALNGRGEEGVPLVQRAFRRNPFAPDWYFDVLGESLVLSHRVEEALPVLQKCVERLPDLWVCHLNLAVAYVESGKLEEATAEAREVSRLNPKVTAEDNPWVRAIGVPDERSRVVEALRRAGLK